jgi:hypothetical protein
MFVSASSTRRNACTCEPSELAGAPSAPRTKPVSVRNCRHAASRACRRSASIAWPARRRHRAGRLVELRHELRGRRLGRRKATHLDSITAHESSERTTRTTRTTFVSSRGIGDEFEARRGDRGPHLIMQEGASALANQAKVRASPSSRPTCGVHPSPDVCLGDTHHRAALFPRRAAARAAAPPRDRRPASATRRARSPTFRAQCRG